MYTGKMKRGNFIRIHYDSVQLAFILKPNRPNRLIKMYNENYNAFNKNMQDVG